MCSEMRHNGGSKLSSSYIESVEPPQRQPPLANDKNSFTFRPNPLDPQFCTMSLDNSFSSGSIYNTLLPLFNPHGETVTSVLAADPAQPVHKAVEQLYGRGGALHAKSGEPGEAAITPQSSSPENESAGLRGKLHKLAEKLHIEKKQENSPADSHESPENRHRSSAPKRDVTAADVDVVATVGDWGTHGRPSDLFLQVRPIRSTIHGTQD